MDDKLRTELRWRKIENSVAKLTESPHWPMLIPSMKGGFEVLTVPVRNGDFEETEANMVRIYNKNHKAGDDDAKKTAMCMIELLNNGDFGKNFSTVADFTGAVWWLYGYFKVNTDCVEVFKDKKIIFIDINMIQVPTTKPTLH